MSATAHDMTDLQKRYAEKIAGLLRKAEKTPEPAEAELLSAKAEELMAKYAIETAMLEAATDREREKIVERSVTYTSASFHLALYKLGSTIAKAQGCRTLQRKYKNASTLYLIGFESDVERAIMLDSSLQVQMQAAYRKALRDGDVRSEPWMTANQKWHERREFMFGFERGVRDRLHKANHLARDEYKAEAVQEGNDAACVTTGMEVALRSRKDRINDWVDQTYGDTLRTTHSNGYSRGSSRSSQSGYSAGTKADTGSSGRLRGRRVLTP